MSLRPKNGLCRWILYCIAVCLFTVTKLSAQRYPFFNIGIEQGLVQSQVFKLMQDSAGHLWAGTLGGLSCYDGKTFRTYTVRDGLPSNTVTALCCTKEGAICIGTARGLSIFDGHAFRNYTFTSADNPKGNSVTQLSLAPDGTLWCIAGTKLYCIKEGKTVRVPMPPHVDKIGALRIIGRDAWTGSPASNSIYRFRNGSWDSLALPAPAPFFVFRIYEDAQHRILLLSERGFYRYENGSWACLMPRSSNKDPLLYACAQARDGSYWLATTNGAIRLSEQGEQYFNRQNGFTDLLVYDVISDREGNIWFASNGEGIYRFSGAPFTAVDEHMGLTAPQVSSIAQDERGLAYFGTYDGGLFRYSGGRATQIPFPGLQTRVPIASLELRNDILWIGTQNTGLWQYNTLSGAMKQYPDKRLSTVMMMSQDTSGIWIGNGRGVFLVTSDSARELNIRHAVEAFALIGRDSLLLSTSEGFLLYSKDTAKTFATNSGADSAQIVCMTARQGIVWIGTGDNGIFGYQLGTGNTIHISRKDGLRSDFIYNLYAAPNGEIWAGTGFGICRIRPAQPKSLITFYGRNAGLTGMESNKNAVLPLADGSIWFGTTGGALLYHPQNAQAVTRPVSLQLQSVAVFGEAVKDTNWFHGTSAFYNIPQALQLPWQKNNLSFSFAAISLTGDEAILYRYRLDGLPAPWSEWSPANTVTFSALPPGHYELLVECSTDGVNPQPETLRYPFEIITPFHKTTLFRLLIIAACIILGVALQYLAARRKRNRLAQLEAVRREEQAKVRQRTAEDFHDEVGNKLTRINVLTNVLRSKVGAAPDASRIIDQIQDNAGQLYSGTRDILWSLQPSNDNLYQVMNRIRDFGRDLFGDTDTEFEMADVPSTWKDYHLPMDASRNLIMIFKEALNNVLKYSGATRVEVYAMMRNNELVVALHDNGEGFDPDAARRGQGINNMNTRAGRLGGTIDLRSAPGEGTQITLCLKIPQNALARTNSNSRTL